MKKSDLLQISGALAAVLLALPLTAIETVSPVNQAAIVQAVLAQDMALLTAEGTTQVTLSDGRTFNGLFAVSLVFVHRDGQWKLFHGHYSIPNQPQ